MRLSAVFQEFNRYQATVRENVSFRDLPEEKLRDALERSGASEVAASLPDGVETRLGKEFHQGEDLSHGQWQKLAIARAYAREAELLILDEPASALDAQAEASVYEHFARMARARTVVLISHRLGSCRLAQRIVVLERGRIVEEGSHEELLERGGRYAELYRMQAAWYM